MKLPLKWLKEYVDYNVTHDEFVEKMMWRGFEIAAVEPELPDVEGVVVGLVLTVEDHPDAKKLHVCTVDAGQGEATQIVCGAPNVAPGCRVPVALPGAKLPGGIEIQPVKMRGVESFGMLCSGKELGLTDADYPGSEVNGLLLLQDEPAPGTPIAKALDMEDVIFEIELTPNRADCQSIIGICREAAAALGQKFVEPEIREVAGEGKASDYASVTIENYDLCPRYCARVVVDLNIEPSPRWLQKKLRSVGLRPINNIVDITNLVMVEYGHPMHAFDLACVADGHIVVRNAKPGEVVTTLDSKERPVTEDMLLIADPVKGVGIAGVMGGENSEITENTKATLFEAAVFKGANIRATCRKLRHTTDAAARFTKGVEPVNAMKALQRAIELVEELKAGRVIGETLDVCEEQPKERIVEADWKHVNAIINTDIAPEKMVEMLASISISSYVDGEKLVITVPHYRVDIESGIETDWDIAEEIGRIYGYYNIEPTLMQGDTFQGCISPAFRDEDMLKDELVGMGAYEMYNYNFIGPADLDALLLGEASEKRQAVKLMNPFGEDQSLMRTTLLPGMLRSLATNLNRKTGQTRFYEVGNVHFDNNDDLPEERKMLGLLFAGADEDFYSVKGAIESLLAVYGIKNADFVVGGGEYLQPGQKAQLVADGTVIGELGAVHPHVLKNYDAECRAFIAEIDLKKFFALKDLNKTYKALPRYPMVGRDLAVIVEQSVQAGDLKKAIESAPVPAEVLVENVELFDVFRGAGIAEGMKSMAYSFTLRAEDRTLNDEDITASVAAILDALKEKFGAVLRG
ncbi:MAG: phenylalanine--tRNA ligase subunit beta [Clostridia bacterium]|nr:phenylalanine--tRNA ligase subunit beta [Clostridia bacterium]